MKHIRFSIVMPMYNVEKYVAQAIKSILNQTYPAYELIVVDDCATDQSAAIVEQTFKEYEENHFPGNATVSCKLLKQPENRGVSEARNRGLDEASGDYILFLDPDDFVEKNLLEVLATQIEKSGSTAVAPPDILVYALSEEYYDTEEQLEPSYVKIHRLDSTNVDTTKSKQHIGVDNIIDCDEPEKIYEIVKDLERETMYGYPWNKAYNLKFLKESCVRFKKITHVEDILFNIQIFMNAKHVVILPNVLYHYRNSGQVRLTSKYLPEYFQLQKRRFQAFIDQQRSWNSLDDRALEIEANAYFRSFISMMQRELAHYESENESIAAVGGTPKSAAAIREAILEKSRVEMNTDLFRILHKHVGGGKVAKLLYKPLAAGKLEHTYLRVRMIHYVRNNFSGLFMKLKQNR
jgi:glycosyltransferase involved in cell wall biosynthesis